MKIDVKNRNLCITLGLGAAAVAYAFLLFLPTQRSIAALQTELASHQDYIAQQQASSLVVPELEAELRATREFANDWAADAPNPNRLAPVIGQLSQCAANSGVTTLQLDPQPVEKMAFLNRVPVSMVCEGNFPQVFEFLQQIEQRPHSIWIDDLQLTKERSSDDSIRCELTLVVFADKDSNSN